MTWWSNFVDWYQNKPEDTEAEAKTLEEKQFAYQRQLVDTREAQRAMASKAMGYLMDAGQTYKTPDSVTKYANLMTSLGGELSQLRDPSNKSSIDLSQYTSTPQEYARSSFKDLMPSDVPLKNGKSQDELSQSEKFKNKNKPLPTQEELAAMEKFKNSAIKSRNENK
jgi:hypothetical protein